MNRRFSRHHAAGFSLIEVTLSLGIIAFALVAVMGLLPAGLNSQKDAADQSRGVQALNDLAQAVRGIYEDKGTLKFAPPLQDVDVSQKEIDPKNHEVTFALMEDGRLAPDTPDTRTSPQRRGTGFYQSTATHCWRTPRCISLRRLASHRRT